MVSLGFIVFLIVVAIAAPLVVEHARAARARTCRTSNLTDSFGSPLGPELRRTRSASTSSART